MKQTDSYSPTDNNTSKKKKTSKQIVAIIGIVCLLLLYIITLITAFIDTGDGSSAIMFKISLTASAFIPFLIWVYIWMYGQLTQKDTIADLNIGGANHIDTKKSANDQILEAAKLTEQASEEDE